MTKEIYCIDFLIALKPEKSHSQACDKVFQLESQNEITNAKTNHIQFLSCKILRYNHEFQLPGNIL